MMTTTTATATAADDATPEASIGSSLLIVEQALDHPRSSSSNKQLRRRSSSSQHENHHSNHESSSRVLSMQQASTVSQSAGLIASSLSVASMSTSNPIDSSASRRKQSGRQRSSRHMSHRMSSYKRGLVKLDFSHLPLYGRFQEKLSIVNSMSRVVGTAGVPAEVILLFGKGGTGKTSLVNESMQDCFHKKSGKHHSSNLSTHFLGRGKFEQSNLSNKPFAAVVEVFSDLMDSIIHQMGQENGEDYASSVKDALGDEAYRITTLIPKLVDLIGERPPNEDQEQVANDGTTFRRLLNLLRAMLRAICFYQRPVVLFFDDLQNADSDSLAVFKYLANDPEVTNLLVIGAYEDATLGVESIDRVTTILEGIDQVKTTLVRLENLSENNINHMLSDVMEMEKALTKKLAHTVYKTTKGNAFFVIHFLELIAELGFLQFQVESKQWLWDRKTIKRATETLEKKMYSSDKVKFAIAGRISHLPHTAKLVLSTAACLGSSKFDIKVLLWLLKDKKLCGNDDDNSASAESAVSFMSAMMTSFRSSVNSGLPMNGDPENDIRGILMGLEKIGMVRHVKHGQYRFAHDRVQQAAYDLIPEGTDRNTKHWKTGHYLKQLLDKPILEDDWLFFTMIDQLNRGSSCISDEEESLELSALNLRAAYKAKERSAVTAAAQYAYYGLAYLDESTKWNVQLSLSLKLTNLAAEMALSCGDNASCFEATKEIIENDELDFQEKVSAYVLKIKMLVQKKDPEAAAKTTMEMLAKLGENFAPKPSVVNVVLSLANLKGLVKGKKTDDEWLDMDPITDATKLTIMRLLAFATYAAASDKKTKDYVAPFRCRMFQFALKNGRCEESAVAYTGYGILLATTLSDYAEAYRFGNLGLQLQQLMNCTKYDARVAYEFYAYTHHLREPIRYSLVPLQQSFRKGIRYSTIQDALIAASVHCSHYLCSGRPLLQLSDIFKESLSLMKEYTPSLYLAMVPYGQLVKNLMGKAPNAKVLNGDVMDLATIMMQIKSTNNTVAFRSVLCAQIELACWSMQYKNAYQLLKEVTKLGSDVDFNARFAARRLVFCEAIIHLGLARTTDKAALHMRNARGCTKKMQKYVQQGAVDCVELSEILEAEILSLNKKAKPMEVTRAYQKAITTCVNSRAHQNIGLANELASRYQKSVDDDSTAMLFLEQAHLSYTEWNAFEKAQKLVQDFPELEQDTHAASFAPHPLPARRRNSNISNFTDDFSHASSQPQREAIIRALSTHFTHDQRGTTGIVPSSVPDPLMIRSTLSTVSNVSDDFSAGSSQPPVEADSGTIFANGRQGTNGSIASDDARKALSRKTTMEPSPPLPPQDQIVTKVALTARI